LSLSVIARRRCESNVARATRAIVVFALNGARPFNLDIEAARRGSNIGTGH
jgi:hypothetical protein